MDSNDYTERKNYIYDSYIDVKLLIG